jgi:hypothetical protein
MLDTPDGVVTKFRKVYFKREERHRLTEPGDRRQFISLNVYFYVVGKPKLL